MPALLDHPELLRRLVAFNSVSHQSNRPIADFICDYLDRPGVHLARNPSPDDTKVNLVITAGPLPAPPGPLRPSPTPPSGRPEAQARLAARAGLILSGHMDVVPAEEPEWDSDPFTLIRRGEALVGRGAADMKGFLAVAMNRVALLDPSRLASPLTLLFTYDEELGTLGAKRFVETWPDPGSLPSSVVIGEPTSLRVARMHKGHTKLRLALRGASAHSGYPHLGRNAIEPAARALVALSHLRAELEAERPATAGEFPEVPFVTLNLAQVRGGRGGTAVNVVPDACEVLLGARVLPGMGSAELVERIRAAVTRALPGEPFTFEVQGDSPPFLLDAAAPLYRDLCAEAGQRDSASVAFATDAGWLATAGFDCVIFGPGTIAAAHKPNESVPVAELEQAARILDRLVWRYCVERPS